MKNKCGYCDEMAVYYYMPSSERKTEEKRYYCDNCISSVEDEGCSCNWHYMDVNAYTPPLNAPEMPEGIEGKDWRWVEGHKDAWEYLDEKGRPYACVEYDYDADGYDITVQLFFNDEQVKILESFPIKNGYQICDIYLKDGSILKEEFISDRKYAYVLEELGITNNDIIDIKLSEK